ncbi:MAG: hypothetical protein BWX54_01380 [Verrucomicrobia bacterium ADurb.Bin018]|nr:MAG: hypothetical protein BWX54_01380 [Verrucomicrobia bacterium ADurb.Bin018]
MEAVPIKVGMLVSFDYPYVFHSLPLLYEHADRITLAIDHECRSWTGLKFNIADSFWSWLRNLDSQKKIDVYRDDFYRPELDAMSNDTRERNMLAQHMGPGGWHVQVDSDEYFLDFAAFVRFLKQHARWTSSGSAPIDIGAFWIPLFRQTSDGFLYVQNAHESFPLATNRPEYKGARGSDHYVRYTPFCVFHQTWARTEAEIWTKLKNWSHTADFDIQSYFNLWKSIDRHTYRYIRNFHPLIPAVWPQLAWGPGKDIPEFIENYRRQSPLTVPPLLYLRRRLGQAKKCLRG